MKKLLCVPTRIFDALFGSTLMLPMFWLDFVVFPGFVASGIGAENAGAQLSPCRACVGCFHDSLSELIARVEIACPHINGIAGRIRWIELYGADSLSGEFILQRPVHVVALEQQFVVFQRPPAGEPV